MTDELKPYLQSSWEEFYRGSLMLARKVRPLGGWKAVVGIARGGLIPATIVARELDIRHVGVIGIASYHEYQQQGELQILQQLSPEIVALAGPKGEGLLMVDDLVDTGTTFRAVHRMFPLAHRAAVYAKDPVLHVDTWWITVAGGTWIYLPWDTHPATLELRPTLAEQAKLLEERRKSSNIAGVMRSG